MATTEHTHHIRLRSTQLEMPTRAPAEDYESKLRATQEEMERIQHQREELARKKQELEDLNLRKRNFLSQQVELTERLTSALTLIDRQLFEMRNEAEDLEQCRTCFASHLDKLEKINPENWTVENLNDRLERATMVTDLAADEYDQAASHFEGSQSGAIFGRASKKGRTAGRYAQHSEFMSNMRNGFAFNLPILVLGVLALLVWLLR